MWAMVFGSLEMFAAPGMAAAALTPVAAGRAELTLCPQTVQAGLAGRPEASGSLFVLFEDQGWSGSFEIQQRASLYLMFTFTRSCCWVRCFRLGKVPSRFCRITSGVVALS